MGDCACFACGELFRCRIRGLEVLEMSGKRIAYGDSCSRCGAWSGIDCCPHAHKNCPLSMEDLPEVINVEMPADEPSIAGGMKPTPRTDALEGNWSTNFHQNALRLARDLERQLSDALDALARVRADEREACARVCDEESIEWTQGEAGNVAARNCADAIRARKEKE